MKIFRLPQKIRALIFDMDLTLYSNPEYGRYQIDCLVERLALERGLSFDEMNREVEKVRLAWAESHGGKKPSLSNIFTKIGIGMDENVRWREELLEPERFIGKDPKLKNTMEELSRFFILGIVTNNPVLVARKTLAALGIKEYIPFLVGLDTCKVSKPDKIPFLRFSEISACPCENCVSIGDRFDIDLDIPLQIGMGAVLVDGVEDVYELPGVLDN